MPTRTFENLPAAKRARVVAAAVREFASHRYADASLDRIAASAGVAKGSLYQYFANKADLHRHVVFEELGRRKRAAIDAALDPDASFLERLAATCHAGLALFALDVEAAAVVVRLMESRSDPDVEELHRAAAQAGFEHAHAELERARMRGEIREDLDLDVAARLVSHLTGVALVDVLLDRVGSIEALVRTRSNVDEASIRRTVAQVVAFVGQGVAKEPTRRKR